MSGFGGAIGVATGMTVAETVSQLSSFTPVVQGGSVIMALSFSIGVGIFFGFYPARRAALLDPIDALSYE